MPQKGKLHSPFSLLCFNLEKKRLLEGIPPSCCPSVACWHKQAWTAARSTKPTEPQRSIMPHASAASFLQQDERHGLVFSCWIYPAALAEKGKERRGGEKKKNQVLIFKMSKLMWKSQMVNKYGPQNCHLAAVLLTNLRGVCCYQVWFSKNIFWAAVSHLRGLIVS